MLSNFSVIYMQKYNLQPMDNIGHCYIALLNVLRNTNNKVNVTITATVQYMYH